MGLGRCAYMELRRATEAPAGPCWSVCTVKEVRRCMCLEEFRTEVSFSRTKSWGKHCRAWHGFRRMGKNGQEVE